MGPMKIASAHNKVYKIFKKGVGHELLFKSKFGPLSKKVWEPLF